MPGANGSATGAVLTAVTCFGALALLMVAGCGPNDAGGNGPSPQVAGDPGASASGVLLVRGRITPEGLVLEPAFRVEAPPALPEGDEGRHRLLGLDETGDRIFDLHFDGTAVADVRDGPEEHFTFAVPLSERESARLETIELRAGDGRRARRSARFTPEQLAHALEHEDAVTAERLPDGSVRVRWDAERFPMILVRDAESRSVLAFGRGGAATVRSAGDRLEVVVSDGVRSGSRLVTVQAG